MRKTAILAIFLGTAGVVRGAETEDQAARKKERLRKRQAYLAASEKGRYERIGVINGEIDKAVARLKTLNRSKMKRKDKRVKQNEIRKDLRELQALLAELNSKVIPYRPVIDPYRLEVGQIGKFAIPATKFVDVTDRIVRRATDHKKGFVRTGFRVIQVIDESNVLIRAEKGGGGTISYSGGRSRVTRSAIESGPTIWLQGYKTGSLVDGKKAMFPGVFEIVGRRQYQSVINAVKSAFLAEPFDMTVLDKGR